MAIPFAFLAPVRLADHGGAVSAIAYAARNAVHDPRFEQPFDYSHLRSDLAHEEIILPVDCPATFLDRAKLAIALDEAERRKVRTPLSERNRLPQVGLALVVALPPSTEVSVKEAAEILRRIVLAARGSAAIPIHTAIHEARINRHAHALFALRPMDNDGVLGPKLRDFVVRHRHTSTGNESADVVEGVNWPDLTWEIHQTFFHEVGIDLVVDPIAPKPGKHLRPIIYGSGKIINKTNEQIASSRDADYAENLRAIEGSPTHLIETLLRGRSSLRTAELERLCAKFLDSDTDKNATVERILLDQNVITLTDIPGALKPTYATTRRIQSLLTRAVRLIDQAGQNHIKAYTAADEDSVVSEISVTCANRQMDESPLILGAKLADCSVATTALAAYGPIAGTVDMAVTGSSELRALGRNRDVHLQPGRLVVVPHSELIDDQRLARLILAANNVGSELILGHVQSRQTGVVCRHLAAYAADQVTKVHPIERQDRGTSDIVRLLRAGLVRHAVEEMANRGLLEFGRLPYFGEDASRFVVCDDPRRIEELSRTIRADRIRSGSIGKPVPLTGLGKKFELSIGEWIMTEALPNDSTLGRTEFARVLAVDGVNTTIDIASDKNRRIDLKPGPAVRPAAVLSIREARELHAEAKLTLVATDPRRIWSALLLVATRGRQARLHVDPKVAQSKDELIKVARRSLPGALPHHREVRADPDAAAGKIIAAINDSFEDLPAATPVVKRAPRPTNVAEGIRRLLADDRASKLGYEQLFDYVGRHNPEHATNTAQVLSMYGDELTRTIIRFLAGIEPDRTGNTEPNIPFDLPPELDELEPERWNEGDIYYLKQNLRYMSLRAWRRSLRPTSNAAPDLDGRFRNVL
ncbi:MobA/MobL family protein [Bradyrhizobium iriomotense]|uniref:MobA/MobL family protein n=1 Tax=Bradyrhizobium iriomotense TaxID=441950 RepID=UPI001B8A3B92|nr:MobA/MobL family protein [Bradyrhizobium iriomotense]MBR0784803.1 MobA/MobL family protein [Bradyrhizobium iriomotense]